MLLCVCVCVFYIVYSCCLFSFGIFCVFTKNNDVRLRTYDTFWIVNYACYVAFLRRDLSMQEVFVFSVKCKDCVACVLIQQVAILAINISRSVFLIVDALFGDYFFANPVKLMAVRRLFRNKWLNKLNGTNELVVEISVVRGSEDSNYGLRCYNTLILQMGWRWR